MAYLQYKNFALEIAKGNVAKHSIITKFGHNMDVDTGADEDVWNQGGTYVAPTTARVHNIASTDANDTAAGTGARRVLIFGINGSYARTTETVSLNGTSNVATVNSYLHIHLIQVSVSGSGNVNAGKITATAQVDGTVTCSVEIGLGQSESSIFLMPAAHKGYIMRLRARMNNSTASSSATVSLFTYPFGAAWQLKTKLGVNNSGSSFVENDYTDSTPFIIPEKTWIKLRAGSASNNNTAIDGEYDLILVQD